MRTRAAIAVAARTPFRIDTVSLDAPRASEVRVRMVATGVCHTDAAVRDGVIPTPLPAVLGHEGAGIVEEVGRSVSRVGVGDHVVLSANSCGSCRTCLTGRQSYCEQFWQRNFAARREDGTTAFTADGREIGSTFFGQSSFSEHANVSERSLVPVPREEDLTMLAPLGCGIHTGAGTVFTVFRPGPGASLVVFGVGAVGAAAVMAARSTGATRIIAIDIVPERRELAAELGATHTLDGADPDLARRVTEITGGRGVDFALDTTARPTTLRTACDSLAIGGMAVEVGSSPADTEVPLEVGASLGKGWTVRTVSQGSSVPQLLIPALIDLWRQGRFPFDRLIRRYPFTSIDRALDDAARGVTVKPVLIY
ncbi:NAD(P)-dependent alcohol dehydrogenase [Microbacterium aquimaris]|uniref:NAD(P)-dependent alcohol dehydrogenase n=1 Tax=Microbacterium aquimaris TaxID=459816 RepID=A0ABU5N703_9MICO|nr:NAD(P)-dependent alcohol dehydrogenase [Microbacterium aquimaris]MDZ8161849.1 NAD(P)-dependent alcohol dehydrogenase [Microbacterium aquimaris]